MARQYEIVYIFDSALEEAQVNERLEQHHALLKTAEHPQPVTAVNHWGRRTLAYPIDRKETGYYVVVQFETDTSVLSEFERALKLDEAVLRYLLVLNEGITAPVAVGGGDDKESAADAEADVVADAEEDA